GQVVRADAGQSAAELAERRARGRVDEGRAHDVPSFCSHSEHTFFLRTPCSLAQRRHRPKRGTGRHPGSAPRIRPLVGTPVPAVTSMCRTESGWLTEVLRTSRTPSAMPFMPWM